MTADAWRQGAKRIVAGIRKLPVIPDHPNWWVYKSIDGVRMHVDDPVATQIYYDHKILLGKEEGNSSQVNQAYDKFVAKCDKLDMRELLGILRKSTTITRGVVDQWGLVHVGLGALRECTVKTWTDSFQACNLDPSTRVSFEDWLKIYDHTFKLARNSSVRVLLTSSPCSRHCGMPCHQINAVRSLL